MERVEELERELGRLRAFFSPAAPGSPVRDTDEDLLLCHVEKRSVAIALSVIVEVVPAAQLLQLPDADPCVLGALNLRGIPVVVHDLAQRLGGERAPWARTDLILVCEHDGVRLGLKVTAADDVVNCRVSPVTSTGEHTVDDTLVRGLIVKDDSQVVVLDLGPLTSHGYAGKRA
jgi:purine-binding chemotaxis protein CheW